MSGATEQDRPAIESLEARIEGDRVQVSYRLVGVFSSDLLERIELGIPVGFYHEIALVAPRRLWLDRIVSVARVDTQVSYDSLTRRYELTRTVVGGAGDEAREPRSERHSTFSPETMREWMTDLDHFPLLELPVREVTERLRIRAESVIGRRWYLLVPTRRTVSEERDLGRAGG